jgi:hypothetical protein
MKDKKFKEDALLKKCPVCGSLVHICYETLEPYKRNYYDTPYYVLCKNKECSYKEQQRSDSVKTIVEKWNRAVGDYYEESFREFVRSGDFKKWIEEVSYSAHGLIFLPVHPYYHRKG